MRIDELQHTIQDMVQPGKGILAADESTGTITKRFAAYDIESTAETRCQYREALFTAPGLNQYISGVILFEETLTQVGSDGRTLGQVLASQGIVPGIKVDKGLIPVMGGPDEQITQGLDGLPERLQAYKKDGARFAKWRAVFHISETLPSQLAVEINASRLAHYAALCQEHGIVPIVEPEVLINGDHTIETCEAVTEGVLHQVFDALCCYEVFLEGMILKPSMVIAGQACTTPASVEAVAEATVRVLKRTVPAAVPSINFLSGGQTDEQATAHLAAMNALPGTAPWMLSFSYGRGLQAAALKAWAGQAENRGVAQEALLLRAKLNAEATQGKYDSLAVS